MGVTTARSRRRGALTGDHRPWSSGRPQQSTAAVGPAWISPRLHTSLEARDSLASVPSPSREAHVLATVAHELRGPLTALATSSELLAEDFELLDPAQVRHMLSAIHRRTVWLQGLVENLLCAATVTDGRLPLHRQPLNVNELITDVGSLVQPLLAQRGQRLRVRVAGRLPDVLADQRRVGQVIINLIQNASKFGAPGSAIDLTVSRRHGAIRVAVADRGPGIDPQQAWRLFEPYYRAEMNPGAPIEGVGLGLSIVKSIVDAHGGSLGVERRSGGGARFWFELPTDS